MLNRFKQKIFKKVERLKGGKVESFKISELGDNIKISTNYALGQINFHELENIVVEMSVTNLADGENKFYLHFELRDLAYAEKLFEEMLQAMLALKDRQSLKVLLSCTGGLTTGFFADKLNSAAKILSLDYEFSAAPLSQLDEVAKNFEIILLAPQIAYKLNEVKKIFADKLVIKIPPRIFASYDVTEMLKFVRGAFDNKTSKISTQMQDDLKILSLSVRPGNGKTYITCVMCQEGTETADKNFIGGMLRERYSDFAEYAGFKNFFGGG